MAGEEKLYSLDIRLHHQKGGRDQEQRGTMVNFGIKIDAGLKKRANRLIKGWIVLDLGVRCFNVQA